MNLKTFQLVVVMPPVQAVYNVPIQVANVLVRLAIKVSLVTLLADVILQGQVEQHVMLLQGNVLVTLVTQVPHAIPAPPITTEQAMELVKVS